MSTLLTEIESKYGFPLPAAYREMQSRGWYDLAHEIKARGGCVQPADAYLWLNDAEWLPLPEILEYDFLFPAVKNFVPFAITGAGDTWCWLPEATENERAPVVLFPHDWHIAAIYAPHFEGFIYRQALDYATDSVEVDEEQEARAWLQKWANAFAEFFPPEWTETLLQLSAKPLIPIEATKFNRYTGFLTQEENREILRRDLPYSRLNEEFDWWSADE